MEGHPHGVERADRDRVAGERDVDDRDAATDERRAGSRRVLDQRARFQAVSGDFAEQMAAQADRFADLLEVAAGRGDADRRLRIAAAEREIARVHRRNAARLRSPDDQRGELEPVPHLPQFEGRGDNPPDQTEPAEGD